MRMKTWLAAGAALWLLLPSAALAHGREPSLGAIAFDPSDPDRIVVRATWGFISSLDDGETWTWQCASAVPFDRTREDPEMVISSGGHVLLGTFDGLVRSDARACSWEAPEPRLSDVYVVDVASDPSDPSVVWTVASSGREPDALFRSDDRGATWTMISSPHPTSLSDRLSVAPSDPNRIYMSGVIPRRSLLPTDAGPADGGASDAGPPLDAGDLPLVPQGMFLRSDDRGETFLPLPQDLVEDERTFHVLGVDPTDPLRVFARAVRVVTDEVPERLMRSDDGGESWVTAAERTEIVGFAMSDDGQHVWIGSWDGGLLRSDDRGVTFTVVDPDVRVRCLGWRPGELWVCIEGFSGDFALARSTDLGDTLTPVWAFEDATMDVGCPAGTPVGDICPMFWPDQITDLMLDRDGSMSADAGVFDGGPGAEPPTGCSCRAAAPSGARALPILALATLLLALARRRR